MIAANYTSAWAGWLLLAQLPAARVDAFLGPRPIERLNLLAAATFAFTFAAAVLIEAPFVHFAINRARRSVARTLLASFTVNAASYTCLALFFVCTMFTLPFNAHVAPLTAQTPPPPGTLDWVDPTGAVLASPLAHPEQAHQVARLPRSQYAWPFHLDVVKSDTDPAHADLIARYCYTYGDAPPDADGSVVQKDVAPTAAFPSDYWDQDHTSRKHALDLRPPNHRQTAVAYDWGRQYLDTDPPDAPRAHLTIAIPPRQWIPQEPTVLPDDKVLYECDNQILLFDPHTRRLSYVAPGNAPAFVPAAP